MDGHYPSPTARQGERRSPPATAPSGLPLVSCAPLTAAERVHLAKLAEVYRSVALAIEDALERGTVDRGLQVTDLAVQAGQAADRVLVEMGRNRESSFWCRRL